jgi:hypothetical protein
MKYHQHTLDEIERILYINNDPAHAALKVMLEHDREDYDDGYSYGKTAGFDEGYEVGYDQTICDVRNGVVEV